MTDYENTFVGWNEIGGALPITGYTHLKPMIEEFWPQKDSLMALETPESRPILARNKFHRENIEARIAAAEEGGEEEEDEEEGGDEEGEEGEEGGEGEGEGEEEAEE